MRIYDLYILCNVFLTVYSAITDCKTLLFHTKIVESVENYRYFMLNRFKTVENSVEKVENGLNKGFSLKRFVEKYRKEQISEIKKTAQLRNLNRQKIG